MRSRLAAPIWRYFQQNQPDLPPDALWQVRAQIKATNWSAPESPIAWNNLGVLLLAQATLDRAESTRLASQARDAFVRAFKRGCPQAGAHLTIVDSMTGASPSEAIAFHRASAALSMPQGQVGAALVILPPNCPAVRDPRRFGDLLQARDGWAQAAALHGAAIEASRPFPFDPVAQRARRLALDVAKPKSSIWLSLGAVNCAQGQVEGLAQLQRATHLAPATAAPLHCLALASRDLSLDEREWIIRANAAADDTSAWQWRTLVDQAHTIVPYDDGVMAAPATLKSITTSTLLTLGDWFEDDIPLWRFLVTRGMTVMDVGANAGVYTLSAASRVGPTGTVIAIEPNAASASLLRQSLSLNSLNNTTLLELAASSSATSGWLTGGPSELGRLVKSPNPDAKPVTCQTLDAIAQEHAQRPIDLLKIDVEGHELSVLQGAMGILDEQRPIVFYENIRPGGYNKGAALFLKGRGYRLYRYLGGLKRLVEADDAAMSSALNLIALPNDKRPEDLDVG